MRDDADEFAEFEQADEDLEDAAEDDGGEEVLDAMDRNECDDDDGHGAGGTGDHAGAAAEDGGDDAHDESGIEPDERRDAGDEGECDGFGDEGERDGDAREDLAL